MAFRRFQTGTLGRSIRRFGRFPRAPFKRKSFGYFTATSSETAMDITTPAPTSIVVFDPTDWSTGAAGLTGVRFCVVDLQMMVTWSPQVTTLAYDSWYLHWFAINCDRDDAHTSMSGAAFEYKPLVWGAQGRNTGEQPSALGASPDSRSINARMRFKTGFIPIDNEIRFMASVNGTATSTIADMRISLVAVVKYELP